MKTLIVLIFSLLLFNCNIKAQNTKDTIQKYRIPIINPLKHVNAFDSINLSVSQDSVYRGLFYNEKFRSFIKKPAFQITYIPISFFVLGGLSYTKEKDVREMRNFNIPKFHHHYDDYLQYMPGAAVIGLKAFGYDGRSSWGRLTVSSAISAGIMGTLVNSIKYGVKKERPDHSAHNSFPSGHSAVAFTTATILHKEYGLTRSPLYSIAGYSVASAVALSRIMNNKHWTSDIFVGAGIGILSTELGYYLTDLIFKDKGLIRKNLANDYAPYGTPPSFISLSSGYSIINHEIDIDKSIKVYSNGGLSLGLEGAWFWNTFFGFGGKLGVRTNGLSLNTDYIYSQNPGLSSLTSSVDSEYMGFYTAHIGPYFSFPLSDKFLLGSKFIAGLSRSSESKINFLFNQAGQQKGLPEQLTVFKTKNQRSWGFETGLSMTAMISDNTGFRFFVDYSFAKIRPHYSIIQCDGITIPQSSNYKTDKDYIQAISIGAAICAFFF